MKRYFVLLAFVVVAVPAFSQGCPTGATWCSGTYSYDGMGNIRAIGSDTYIYDTVGRLVSGTAEVQRGGTSQQKYEYDTFGNRTAASRTAGSVDCPGGCEQSPTIDSVTNHITGNSAVYDAAGNLISITNTVGGTAYTSTYVYDAAGSMARATAGSDDRQFIYTADDERIATRNGQSWTWTVRGLDSKVLREFTSAEPNNSPGLPTSTRTWAKDYVWRDGQLLASVTPTTPGASTTVTQHFHLDHLGTPRLVSNDNGVQTGIHGYYPFGAELNLTPNEQPTELMKFTGHERDVLASNPNTLDYMHARYEMGTTGRFLSLDPVVNSEAPRNPQMWNRYTYAVNSPVRFTDPTGREHVQEPGFTKPLSKANWGDAPPAVRAAFFAEGGMLAVVALEAAGSGLSALLPYAVSAALALAPHAPEIVEMFGPPGTNMTPNIGMWREEVVAKSVGGLVSGEELVVKNVGKTDIDVIGKAGEYIAVGGPAKALNLARFGQKLDILRRGAAEAKVAAKAYLAEGTPQKAIDLAKKILGADNVVVFRIVQ